MKYRIVKEKIRKLDKDNQIITEIIYNIKYRFLLVFWNSIIKIKDKKQATQYMALLENPIIIN